MKARLKNNQGIAMVVVIVMMVILLSITGAALLFSGLSLKASANLKTGSGAIHAADAGIQHGLAVIPSGTTYNYSSSGTSVVPTTVFPDASSGYSYVVTATNNPPTGTNTSTAILTSTATGPNSSKRVIKAYIGRSGTSWTPPGAVYLPGQSANVAETFTGNSFLIKGNDTTSGGTTAGPLAAVPGIATSAAGTTDEITGPSGSLTSDKYGQVTGQGSNPSVATSSTSLDVNQLANDLLNLGVEGVDKQTKPPGIYSATAGLLGTEANPKITNITGNATLLCGSGATDGSHGYGVIIVDGNLSISGLYRFQGLIIVRGTTVGISGGGNGGVWGALLVKENTSSTTTLTVSGSANVYYSSQALSTYVLNRWGSAFPKKAKLIAWHEVMQ